MKTNLPHLVTTLILLILVLSVFLALVKTRKDIFLNKINLSNTNSVIALDKVSTEMEYDNKFGSAYFVVELKEDYPYDLIKINAYSEDKNPPFNSQNEVNIQPIMDTRYFPQGDIGQDYSFRYSSNKARFQINTKFNGDSIVELCAPSGECAVYKLACNSQDGGPPYAPIKTVCTINSESQEEEKYRNLVYSKTINYYDILDSRKKLDASSLDPDIKSLVGEYENLDYYLYTIDIKNLHKKLEIKDIRFYFNDRFYKSSAENELKNRMQLLARKISGDKGLVLDKVLVTSSIYSDGFDASGRYDYIMKWNIGEVIPNIIIKYILENTGGLLKIKSGDMGNNNFFEITSASGGRRALRINLLNVVDY